MPEAMIGMTPHQKVAPVQDMPADRDARISTQPMIAPIWPAALMIEPPVARVLTGKLSLLTNSSDA